ncbi:MAG: hypothetical protein ACTS3F_12880 [Phycisphaerales bacterium]
MNAEPATSTSTPKSRGWIFQTAGIIALPGMFLSAFIALWTASFVELAANQPGCGAGAYLVTMWLCGLLAVLCAAMVIAWLGRGRIVRSIVCAALIAAAVLPISAAAAFSTFGEIKGIAIHTAGRLRSIGQARQAAEANGIEHAATLLLLLPERYITPEIMISPEYACPLCPPMPDPGVFNYNGITMDDALQGLASEQEIIDAANAVLGDEPWERIGWTWHLRDGRPYQPGADPEIIVGGGIFYYQYERAMIAQVLHADASVRTWHPTDPDLHAKLHAATTAAERLGVAPPPRELFEFVNTTSATP